MQGVVHPHKIFYLFIYLIYCMLEGMQNSKLFSSSANEMLNRAQCVVPILHASGLQVGQAFDDFGICNVMAKQLVAFLIFLLVFPT